MRFMNGTTRASLLVVGALLLGAAPAVADDDIYFNHAKGTMSGSMPAATPSQTGQNGRYTASYPHYMQVEPRDMKVDKSSSQNADGENIYFHHAMGTMGGD